uniref:Uncharacterized protein n=1 Tax=Solanum lycopersicum TaxID=4081 RepID=K4AWK3_SOLLC
MIMVLPFLRCDLEGDKGGKLAAPTIEVDFVKCDCCGLTEDCTLAYIETILEWYQGKWICGLCAEAVKDEMMRCERLINAEESLTRHLHFCKKFSSSTPPPDPTIHLIAAMRQLLRKSYGDRVLQFGEKSFNVFLRIFSNRNGRES